MNVGLTDGGEAFRMVIVEMDLWNRWIKFLEASEQKKRKKATNIRMRRLLFWFSKFDGKSSRFLVKFSPPYQISSYATVDEFFIIKKNGILYKIT